MLQELSEEFIEKFKYKVCWYCISQCQILSEEFKRKYKRIIIEFDMVHSGEEHCRIITPVIGLTPREVARSIQRN